MLKENEFVKIASNSVLLSDVPSEKLAELRAKYRSMSKKQLRNADRKMVLMKRKLNFDAWFSLISMSIKQGNIDQADWHFKTNPQAGKRYGGQEAR